MITNQLLYHLTKRAFNWKWVYKHILIVWVKAFWHYDNYHQNRLLYLALDKLHPQFGFAKHKGYPTKAHFEAIEQHGVISEHRKSFKPVKKALGIE